jgi:hypothetical protein
MFTIIPTCVLYIVLIHLVLIPCFVDLRHCSHLFYFSYHHLYVFVWRCLLCKLKDNLDFKLESAMGSQKYKNWKRGIIWPGLIERAKHFALQLEVGVAL